MKVIYIILSLCLSPYLYAMESKHQPVLRSNSSESLLKQMPPEIQRHIMYQADSLKELGTLAQTNSEFARVIKGFNTQDFDHFFSGKITQQDKEMIQSYFNQLDRNSYLTGIFFSTFIDEKVHVSQTAADIMVFKCKHYDTRITGEHSAHYFFHAIAYEYPQVITALLKAGASIDMPNSDGTTPLMMASLANKEALVKQFLYEGADVHLKNNAGDTAYTLAASNEIKKILDAKIHEQDYNAQTQPMDIEQ